MGYAKELTLFFICFFLAAVVLGQQCNVVPKCDCTFGGDDVPVEEQSQKAEVLAGTVGALGSLLVSGGAFGIWHLLRNRKGGGDVFGRSISNMSDDSIQSRGRDGKEPPPPYGDQNQGLEPDTENTAKPPNIYRASMYDEINPWGPKLQRHA